MVEVLVWIVFALVSFAASAMVVYVTIRMAQRQDRKAAAEHPEPPLDPDSWREFERGFADYVRAGDRGGS
jgi:hypothetical protein